MRFVVAEVVGIFLVVVGCGALVAAATLVSTALAVAAAGSLLVLGGVLTAYAAAVLEQRARAAELAARSRP